MPFTYAWTSHLSMSILSRGQSLMSMIALFFCCRTKQIAVLESSSFSTTVASLDLVFTLRRIFLHMEGFAITVCRLYVIATHRNCVLVYCQAITNRKIVVDRLQSVYALAMRKFSLEQKRLTTKTKVSGGSSVSLARNVNLHHRIRPVWMMRRDTVHGFDDPMLAVSFMMSSLQLQPK